MLISKFLICLSYKLLPQKVKIKKLFLKVQIWQRPNFFSFFNFNIFREHFVYLLRYIYIFEITVKFSTFKTQNHSYWGLPAKFPPVIWWRAIIIIIPRDSRKYFLKRLGIVPKLNGTFLSL
jgi:hypothetical protein